MAVSDYDKIMQAQRQRILDEYILNGGKKVYNYKISDDITKKVLSSGKKDEKNKKVQELITKLNETNSKFTLDNQHDGVSVDNVSLERKEAKELSDEQIKDMASSELQDYKNSSINAIKDESKLKEQQLNENKQMLQESANEQKENLAAYYDSAKENVSNQALQRGLARSSIVINQLGAFDENQINDFNKIDTEITEKVNNINFELSGLNGELQKALNDFDIGYAVKLKDKINNLNSDLEKEQSKIIEYNNQIALQEAQFNKGLDELREKINSSNWNKQTDLADIYGKYGSGVVNRIVQESLYQTAKNYLKDFEDEEVLELLKDENFKLALGSAYDLVAKDYTGR